MTTTTERRRTTFGGVTIEHDDTVLAPRIWTLLQSDWAVELAEHVSDGPVLELCCGAGHIGLEAIRRTDRSLVQVDVCESACDFARRNAVAAGESGRVEVRCVDLSALRSSAERYPLVLADPPYLPSDQVEAHPSDPARSIDGGSDGLTLLRQCIDVIDAVLLDGGVALVQVAGVAQAMEVTSELPDTLRVTETREHDRHRAVVALARGDRSAVTHSPRGDR